MGFRSRMGERGRFFAVDYEGMEGIKSVGTIKGRVAILTYASISSRDMFAVSGYTR